MLDNNGNFFYRKSLNEINRYGTNWELINISKNPNTLNRVVDFDIGNKDMISINANGEVVLYKNINRPRIYDK
jgi:hypothetical protein